VVAPAVDRRTVALGPRVPCLLGAVAAAVVLGHVVLVDGPTVSGQSSLGGNVHVSCVAHAHVPIVSCRLAIIRSTDLYDLSPEPFPAHN
jgi:ABC-type uncharacterized transport system YnjBCD ATPase subunit